jgi:diguanylate cyclase (GGDEF)-like protein
MHRPLAHDSVASTRLDAAALQLESALQLIGRAGVELPPREENPQAWMQALIDALCDLSSRDALTGLVNRRQFELSLEREIDRVARSGEPALVLVLDIDHFKRVNDTHGHAAGDAVIRTVARLLQDSVRPMDTVARIGGEEYGIVLPNCAPAFGQAVAERIRRRVHNAAIDIGINQTLAVTLSVGGAFAPQWVRSSARLWTERADQQLYRAKTEGRNRACLDMPPVSVVSAEEKGMLFALPVVPDDNDSPDSAFLSDHP